MIVNAFSVDVEDYFQVSAFENIIRFEEWDEYQLRVVPNTELIVRILAEHGVKATFFVLGWIAEKCPSLIKYIHGEGHEVGSHGYNHRLIYKQSPEEFRHDLRRSVKILQDITGTPVRIYRAPSYSITKRSLWAFRVLAEEGIMFDSSVFPIIHDRYGIPDASRFIYNVNEGSEDLVKEFPLSTLRMFGHNFPVAGGGYLRLFPYIVTRFGIKKINSEGHPAIVYVHPWELDPGQPRMKVNGLTRFRHYCNLASVEPKVRKLLKEFPFKPIGQILGNNSR